MDVRETIIEGVKILTPKIFLDQRGLFLESWNRKTFAEIGISDEFVQDNISVSCKGVLRGVHTQLCFPQSKLVSCVSGSIYDVVVDCRKDSPSFGKWHGEVLSSENTSQIYIPAGVAHGFYAIEDATIHMKVTTHYVPGDEIGFIWNDKDVNIQWPDVDKNNMIFAEKDTHWGSFQDLIKRIEDFAHNKNNSVIRNNRTI